MSERYTDRSKSRNQSSSGAATRTTSTSDSKLKAKVQQLEAEIVGLKAEVDAANVAVAKMATIDEYLSRFPTGHLAVLDGRKQTAIRFD